LSKTVQTPAVAPEQINLGFLDTIPCYGIFGRDRMLLTATRAGAIYFIHDKRHSFHIEACNAFLAEKSAFSVFHGCFSKCLKILFDERKSLQIFHQHFFCIFKNTCRMFYDFMKTKCSQNFDFWIFYANLDFFAAMVVLKKSKKLINMK
jgi:hypothetical protein